MKFEKINKDKIKVTLNSDDLSENDIDFHSFVSDSEETHSLFLDVLERAEKDYGFTTRNYKLKVETVALADGTFVLTITRELDKPSTATNNFAKVPKASRKIPSQDSSSMLYRFDSFDNFCSFVSALYSTSKSNYKKIAKNSILYNYRGLYYLLLEKVNIKLPIALKTTFSLATEFGTYVDYTEAFVGKLYESGKVIFKTKALQNCINYFIINNKTRISK